MKSLCESVDGGGGWCWFPALQDLHFHLFFPRQLESRLLKILPDQADFRASPRLSGVFSLFVVVGFGG
jgi:hypothetical protein